MTTVATVHDGPWPAHDLVDLKRAYEALEHPSFAARVTDLLGTTIEAGIKKLPRGWQTKVNKTTRDALIYAMKIAVKTMRGKPLVFPRLSRKLHGVAVAGTGAAGGAFGLLSLPIELPITTGIMLRAVADIARAEGEDVTEPEVQLACIGVFALGGSTKGDDATDTGYFAVRAAVARAVSQAAEYILEKGVAEEGAPILLRLITRVAQRFSVQVSEKVAAEAIPIIGAAGGATINVIFIDHFQSMARGHFTIRRLERKYGEDAVRKGYEALGRAERSPEWKT